MPLSWNEIRSRALAFSHEWEGETSEDAEAKIFWDGFIDLLWRGVLLVNRDARIWTAPPVSP